MSDSEGEKKCVWDTLIGEKDVPKDIEGWTFESFVRGYLGEEVKFHSMTEPRLTAYFCIDEVTMDWVCKVAPRDGYFFLDIKMEDLTPLEIRRVLEEDLPGRLEAITGFAETTVRASMLTGWYCEACGHKEQHYDDAYQHFVTAHYNRTSVKSAMKS